MLKMFDIDQSQYLNKIVAGNETWLYIYDVPIKPESKFRIFKDKDTDIAVRKLRWIKKKYSFILKIELNCEVCRFGQTKVGTTP